MSMPNQTSARHSAGSPRGAGATDAVSLLTHDHTDVAELFEAYEALVESEGGEDEKQALAEQNLLDEAEVEHATAKDLIDQIQSMDPTDELYDAKVKVLGEYVNHHVQEEEGELFPRCQDADIDLEELGEEISARREELLEELGLDEEES